MRALLCTLLMGAVACGGSAKPDAEEPKREKIVAEHDPSIHDDAEDDEDEGEDDDGMEIEGLAGHLDPYDIQRGIEPHSAALANCYHSQVKRLRFVDGKIEMQYKVGRDGAVKAVQLIQSDLGAWPIELCMLEVARGMTFKKPRGRGDADFSVPLDFTSGRSNARWLSEEASYAEVEPYLPQLEDCDGASSDVTVTLYVGPRGKVQSVGFASRKNELFSDEWAQCAQQLIMEWQLTDPRGKIAKIGFQYNAK